MQYSLNIKMIQNIFSMYISSDYVAHQNTKVS